MGCGGSKGDTNNGGGSNNKNIEKSLAADRQKANNVVKTLILGTGEAGKSTFIKQLRFIFDAEAGKSKTEQGYSNEERKRFIPIIIQNICQCLQSLQDAMDLLDIKFANNVNERNIQEYAQMSSEDNAKFYPQDGVKIKAIWTDAGIQSAYEKRNEYQLSDCCKHYMANIETISYPSYSPSNEDILFCRIRTTGILEYKFEDKKGGTEFVFIDVGGQRAERRKWLHSFDLVTSVIFLASLSDYDLKLAESKTEENRMKESLKLFEYIANHPSFVNNLVIVFLNKRDLFEEKFDKSDFDNYFPDYKKWRKANSKHKGCSSCVEYIETLYREVAKGGGDDRTIAFHATVATDTKAINEVFNSIRQQLIVSALKKAGML